MMEHYVRINVRYQRDRAWTALLIGSKENVAAQIGQQIEDALSNGEVDEIYIHPLPRHNIINADTGRYI